MNIRIATIEDSGAIRAVYAPYIDTPVTFETALPTIEEFEGRVAGILPEYPYLVCEKDGRIIGYAYACRSIWMGRLSPKGWAGGCTARLSICCVCRGSGACTPTSPFPTRRAKGSTWGWASPVSAPIPKRGIKAAAGTMSPVSKRTSCPISPIPSR